MKRTRRQDVNEATLRRWVMLHPVAWGVVSGLLAFMLVFAPTGHLAAVVPGILFGVLNWYLWRANGPGRSWAERTASGR